MAAARLQIIRPFANEVELVASDAWCIERRGMRLFTSEVFPEGTVLRFEVYLASGERMMFGEGEVEPSRDAEAAGAPSEIEPGLWVRFKRFDVRTKELLKKVLVFKRAQFEAAEAGAPGVARASAPPPAPEPPPRSAVRHSRPAGPVARPANRDELLARLRARAKASPEALARAVKPRRAKALNGSSTAQIVEA